MDNYVAQTVLLMAATGLIIGYGVYYAVTYVLGQAIKRLEVENERLNAELEALNKEVEDNHVAWIQAQETIKGRPSILLRLYDPTTDEYIESFETENLETAFMWLKERLGKWNIQLTLKHRHRPVLNLTIEART